ncbi:Smr/MutS family protein [Antarctobacter heliothermus]|uniref:DNA-nicking endonuclease, Smr domain n=1 Tax=Antarctobacter heliothermus TaxID=74033 RepID=A0A239BUE0_9RHOB|nr:Smr/MutS family protein [Antarctobacter heliothermus]SNS10674.1 DNA-nicking endonuclease, Smr domain [Antarctobacter heliothermus]
MTRRRKLRPEEQGLWRQVARTADPLHKRPVRKAADPGEGPKQLLPQNPGPRDPLSPFVLGERSIPRTQTHVFPKTSADHLHEAPVRMDAKAFTRLKRGKLDPEARIDLHGMTVDRAHGALNHFILNAQARGARLVLVITGKGQREDPYDPMPRRRGVLKSQVPTWLQMPPLSGAVLQVSPAHRKHGGDGAYYVYLRRRR